MERVITEKISSSVIVALLLCFVVSGCALDQMQSEKDPFRSEPAPDFSVGGEMPMEEYAKKNHGIVNVHRHGPGYDIMFTLNAGDSDMIFTMDLPEGGESFMPELHDQLTQSASPESSESSPDRPTKPEEEEAFFNEKSLNLFSKASKHMLNAQALFYRKSYWKALEETNRAVSLVPKSAQAYALKGSIYFKMGRKSDAKKSWQIALKLDPTLVDVKESLNRIK